MDSEYLKFYDVSDLTTKKTKSWEVRSKRSNTILGEIHWYTPWRQYVFYPSMQTLFNTGCLYDLSKFLDSENIAHKEALRMARVKGT